MQTMGQPAVSPVYFVTEWYVSGGVGALATPNCCTFSVLVHLSTRKTVAVCTRIMQNQKDAHQINARVERGSLYAASL
jgi:hypothetical protein